MKTLIELYDERAIENVIGPETFKPENVVYLCTPEIAQNKSRQGKMRDFFASRGLDIRVVFIECSRYKSDKIYEQMKSIGKKFEDCALDVTGGTDAILFAAGMFAQETGIPTFTYSRKKNRFYDISNAEFAENVLCELGYRVEEFFSMAGGRMRKGRVDNNILTGYMHLFDDFFAIFQRHRKQWPASITFMQRIARADKNGEYSLKVKGGFYQKGEHGGRIKANSELLKDLERIGFIHNLKIIPENTVSFEFADDQIRAWLRDVGSVLELYMYKLCIDSGIYNDVVSSAVVDWDGTVGHDSVSNEIDVVATRGIIPIFISCKACDVGTYALNELSILRDRFGGKGAKAAIATTEFCNAATRHRAAQLGIAVIDREEFERGDVIERLKVIMKVKEKHL